MKIFTYFLVAAVSAQIGLTQGRDQKKDPYERTHVTAFSIGYNDGWVYFAADSDGESDYFYQKPLGRLSDRLQKVWVREYQYKTRKIIQSLWIVDRSEKTDRITSINEYIMDSGAKTDRNLFGESTMHPIGPNTIAEALWEQMNIEEKSDKALKNLKKKIITKK